MTPSTAFTPESIAALRSRVSGPVIVLGGDGLAEDVACFNRSRVQHPDVVVGATDEADVVAAVRCALEHGLPVRVQATGHGSGKPPTGGS